MKKIIILFSILTCIFLATTLLNYREHGQYHPATIGSGYLFAACVFATLCCISERSSILKK